MITDTSTLQTNMYTLNQFAYISMMKHQVEQMHFNTHMEAALPRQMEASSARFRSSSLASSSFRLAS